MVGGGGEIEEKTGCVSCRNVLRYGRKNDALTASICEGDNPIVAMFIFG
jgi:hypothetical protein